MNEFIYKNDSINSLLKTILSQIQETESKYDCIIGIGRGGLIPAAMLGYKLDLKVYNLGISSYKGKTQTSSFTVYQDFYFDDLSKGSRVLIVDDICDSGNTINFVRQRVSRAASVNEVECDYAALLTREKAQDLVDFTGAVIEGDEWIVFSWDK
jgi:xanthine phosphoribosyltransferase